MECSKELSIFINGGCVGLPSGNEWEYNPNSNPGQPPSGFTFDYDFEGYYGTWSAVKAAAPDLSPSPTVSWRTEWTSVFGSTLVVRSTIVGSVNRIGQLLGVIIICRANANSNVVQDSILCPPGLITAVNLTATATNPTVGLATAALANHQIPADGTFGLTGEVFVSCS